MTNNQPAAYSEMEIARLKIAADLKLRIEEARKSPIGLYKLIFTADDGGEIFVKEFHHEWNKIILNYKDVLIEASRGLSKTTFIIACVIWFIGKFPNIRIKYICQDDKHAQKRLRSVRKYIEESKLLKIVFPKLILDKKSPNNLSQLTVVRDTKTPEPTLEAYGVLSGSSGDRCDLLIGDDVCDIRNTVINPALRPQVIDKMLGDWFPTLNSRTGRKIFIFTPWHAEDLHAHLKTKKGFKYAKFTHGTEQNPYHSIFPELYTEEKLRRERANLGAFQYARSYLCLLRNAEDAIVMPENLTTYCRWGLQKPHLTQEKLRTATCVLSIDPAKGDKLAKGTSDFIGVCVFLVYPYSKDERKTLVPHQQPFDIFVPECFHFKIPQMQQVLLIKSLIKQWGAVYTLIEAQGMQALHTFLLQDTSIPLETIYPITVGNKSKGTRLVSAASLLTPMEGHPPIIGFHPSVIDPFPEVFHISLEDGTTVQCQRTLRHEILDFPTTHDDCLDAFTQGINWIKTILIPQITEGLDISDHKDSVTISEINLRPELTPVDEFFASSLPVSQKKQSRRSRISEV